MAGIELSSTGIYLSSMHDSGHPNSSGDEVAHCLHNAGRRCPCSSSQSLAKGGLPDFCMPALAFPAESLHSPVCETAKCQLLVG